MPSGAKKRKALKKKQQQEAIGVTTDNNHHGHDEHGSQDERDSDGSLSSPSSQGNGEFWTRDLSPSPLSGLGKVTVEEKTQDADVTQGQGAKSEDVTADVRGMDHEVNAVDKPPNSFPENITHDIGKVAPQEEAGGGNSVLEIAPAVDSVSKVVISDKCERVGSSTNSDSVQQKSDEDEVKPILKEAKDGNSPGSAAETSKEIKSVKESEVPECSEEKSLLPSGPPVVRTSWLSCCGLFDVMAGSER
ncbi:unnamed protein product [Arabis nemorensis]|uniref:Uncharacterized protein n=1 Tax=Arabis nemorensis TaxID=586526 RepID=A0A565BMI5_9BRAS|nr:unnamed protein product [Arabis nemorensis]